MLIKESLERGIWERMREWGDLCGSVVKEQIVRFKNNFCFDVTKVMIHILLV
jgi:hypothetical protein